MVDAAEAVAFGVHVETTALRVVKYSPRELKLAEEARDMVRKLAFPSDGGLAFDIQHGGLVNNPVTVRALQIGADVWGADIASLKGKAVTPGAIAEAIKAVPKVTDTPVRVFCDVLEFET